MKNKEKKIKYFSCQEGLDSVSNSSNFSWNQQTNSSSKSTTKKHVLSGVLAFFVCFAVFAAVVFPLEQTSQISSPLSTIAATGPNNTDGWWIDDGRRGDSFAGGTGTEDDPYLISTAAELAGLSYLVYSGTTDSRYSQYISGDYYFTGAYFKQTANIDLSDYYWQPIGINYDRSGSTLRHYFAGNYDGGGYTVSGIYTPEGTGNAYSYQGLFGYVYGQNASTMATISNVGVINSDIYGYNDVGGVVGYLTSNSSISNCYNTGNVTGSSDVGGVVGYARSVVNCYNTGNVTGSSYVGGVVGDTSGAVITNCYNTGNVTGSGYTGGIVGYARSVVNCYNLGDVTAGTAGGIIGYVSSISGVPSLVSGNYNLGGIEANNAGGVIGEKSSSYTINILDNYYGGDCLEATGGVAGEDVEGASFSSTLANDAKNVEWYQNIMLWGMDSFWQIDPQLNEGYPTFRVPNASGVYWTNAGVRADGFAGGSGTVDDPYIIETAEQLAYLSYSISSRTAPYRNISRSYYFYEDYYFKQNADIDLSGRLWDAIGTYSNSYTYAFCGIYDGNGYTISGLNILSNQNYNGLFGYLLLNGAVKNLGIVGSIVKGSDRVGAISGYGGEIINCFSTASVRGVNYVGGISGAGATNGNCYNTGVVKGENYTGGIAGSGEVYSSFNVGLVSCSGTSADGISGTNAGFNSFYGGDCLEFPSSSSIYSETLEIDAKDADWLSSTLFWDLENVWVVDSTQNDGYPLLRKDAVLPDYWTDDEAYYNAEWEGTGTQTDPYLISSPADLAKLSANLYFGYVEPSNTYYYYSGIYFKQTENIDMSGHYWRPIGGTNSSGGSSRFSGHYDGGGYEVSGLTTPTGYSDAYSYQGLFGYVGAQNSSTASNTSITNVKVTNSSIRGYRYVGGIIGYVDYGSYIDVSYCWNDATVYGHAFVGGIAGWACPTNSYNTGSISGNSNVGGIVGTGDSPAYCYNKGPVQGNTAVAGISGGDGRSTRYCFNIGSVTKYNGEAGSGGITAGTSAMDSPLGCFYGGDCANIGGVAGSDTAGAQYLATIADDAKNADWLTNTMNFDMYTIWVIDQDQNDGYPILRAGVDYWLDNPDNYNTTFEEEGTRSDPYLISSAADLAGLAYLVNSGTGITQDGEHFYQNKYFKQTQNIDLSEHVWQPIGTETFSFSGNYDGSGFEISGMICSSSDEYSALFGAVKQQSYSIVLNDIHIVNATIMASRGAAGLVIHGERITIQNCSVEGQIIMPAYGISNVMGMAGGIALSLLNGNIENCANFSSINAFVHGGVIGFGSGSNVRNCINYGDFTSLTSGYSGGIVGSSHVVLGLYGFPYWNADFSTIQQYANGANIYDCVNYGDFAAGAYSGGIASVAQTISNCINYGDFAYAEESGGITAGANILEVAARNDLVNNVNYGKLSGRGVAGISYTIYNPSSGSRFENNINFGVLEVLYNGAGGTAPYTGGLIGKLRSCESDFSILNSFNYGDIVISSEQGLNSMDIGGIIGYIRDNSATITLEGCGNYAQINGMNSSTSGFVAAATGGSIAFIDCVNAGDVIGGSGETGGFVGGGSSNFTLENCMNIGDISSRSKAGGVFGSVGGTVVLTSVFNLGNVSGSSDIGGLIGSSTATNITITSSVFEGNITVTDSTSDTYAGGFIGSATGCSNLSITGSYVNADITVASSNAYASGMIGSITMSDTSSPAAIDKCAVVANISTSAEGEMTNSREFYFSPNLVDSATILNSYALFNNSLTISDTTTGMDGYFAYLDNFQNGLPIPIGLYYITAYGTTTGIVDQLQKFVG